MPGLEIAAGPASSGQQGKADCRGLKECKGRVGFSPPIRSRWGKPHPAILACALHHAASTAPAMRPPPHLAPRRRYKYCQSGRRRNSLRQEFRRRKSPGFHWNRRRCDTQRAMATRAPVAINYFASLARVSSTSISHRTPSGRVLTACSTKKEIHLLSGDQYQGATSPGAPQSNRSSLALSG